MLHQRLQPAVPPGAACLICTLSSTTLSLSNDSICKCFMCNQKRTKPKSNKMSKIKIKTAEHEKTEKKVKSVE